VWGKVSTVVQIAFVLAIVGQLGAGIIVALKWATVALAIISGVDYARRGSSDAALS
jgi:hypothetical protein